MKASLLKGGEPWPLTTRTRRRAFRVLPFLLVLPVVLLGLFASPARAGKHVLLLNSYDYTYAWSRNINRAVVSTLEEQGDDISLTVEFMDSKRFASAYDFMRYRQYFAHKHEKDRFDLVIASDDNAVLFALDNRDTLFPGAPIVFCGVNDHSLPDRPDFRNITGVLEMTDPAATVGAALRLQPGIRTVYIVNDETTSGKRNKEEALKAFAAFGDRLHFRWLYGESRNALGQRVAHLGKDSILLLLSFARTADGEHFTHEEAAQLLRSHSDRPIYTMWAFYLGSGVVGGRVTSGVAHGRKAAELALRILSGTPADDIPVVGGVVNTYMFDARELERFGIDEDRLPPDSVVVNRTEGVLHRYWPHLLAVGVIMAGMVLFIAFLLRTIHRRRVAEEQLADFALHQEALVEDRTRELAERSQELEEANFKLRQVDKARTAVLNTVAHDLRTPMTTVLGFCKLVQRDFEQHFLPLAGDDRDLSGVGARIVDNLRLVDAEGWRLTRLINDFLDMARIRSGKMTWNDAPVHPAELVGESEPMLEGYFQNSEAAFETVVEADLPMVYVDADRIIQVLSNLVGNAAKFTEYGSVTLSVQKNGQEGVLFSVADTGPGIPDEDLKNVFNPFFQVRDDSGQTQAGSGIGLSICKTIVEHYGGEIHVASESGNGAVFSFSLPAHE